MGYGKEIAIALVGGSLLVTAVAGLGGYSISIEGNGLPDINIEREAPPEEPWYIPEDKPQWT